MATEDMKLLRDYVANGSEEAFAELVSRQVNLVYSVAMRQLGDAHLAEEVTQATFVILARKASSLGSTTILPAWLCRTAHYVAAEALRTQRRRQHREQEAYMQSTMNEPESASPWLEIAPLLDGAMAVLRDKDHRAIVLRFFERKDFRRVGAALGISENAAQKRVNHALEKLRRFFARQGVKATAAVIGGMLLAHSVQAAPTALAKSATAAALTKGATAGGSTLTFTKGALKIMAWTKLKSAVVTGAVVLLLCGGGTGTYVVIQHSRGEYVPKSSWAFSGFATPEASLKSDLWAEKRGDYKNSLEAMTPELAQKFEDTVFKNKTDEERSAMLITDTKIKGVRIRKKTFLPGGLVSLELHFDGLPGMDPELYFNVCTYTNLDGQWKCCDVERHAGRWIYRTYQ